MTEIRFYITQHEIEMLKDFIGKGCTVADINLQWMDELQNLLKTLGEIVTTPGFDIKVIQEQFGITSTDTKSTTIESIMESIIFYRNTIENLKDQEGNKYEMENTYATGWYLIRINDAENKIKELEILLEKIITP